MIVYISGPMTGIKDHNFPRFFEAEGILRDLEYSTLNPANFGQTEGWEWEDYLRRDIVMLVMADGIVLLEGWQESRGAVLEHHIAARLGMRIGELIGNQIKWEDED